jgi:hypothetical protein
MTSILRHVFFSSYSNNQVGSAVAMTMIGNVAGALWIGVPAAIVNYLYGERDPISIRRSLMVGALTGGAFSLVLEREPRVLALRIIAAQGFMIAVSAGET